MVQAMRTRVLPQRSQKHLSHIQRTLRRPYTLRYACVLRRDADHWDFGSAQTGKGKTEYYRSSRVLPLGSFLIPFPRKFLLFGPNVFPLYSQWF